MDARLDVVPCARVLVLFLEPDEFSLSVSLD
jgi:hypothetical protein